MKRKQPDDGKISLLTPMRKFPRTIVETLLAQHSRRLNLANEQIRALEIALCKRESLFVTGQAGTGKSLLIELLQEAFKRSKELCGRLQHLRVTALTGTAANLIGGETLHSFLGAGLFEGPVEALVKKINKNPQLRKKWLEVQTLIVDEFSMFRVDVLSKMNLVAQKIRGNTKLFGGIQLIAFGDFAQLEAIYGTHEKDLILKNYGTHYVFELPLFNQMFPPKTHQIVLTKIFRQADREYQELLSRVRLGQITHEDRKLLLNYVRDPPPTLAIQPSHLWTERKDVEKINHDKLCELQPNPALREVFVAVSEIKSSVPYLVQKAKTLQLYYEKTRASPKILHLALQAQVILTHNLDVKQGLCNGTKGIVIDFKTFPVKKGESVKYPVVRFHNGIELCIMPHVTQMEYQGKVLVTDTQVPLRLAWSLTIHKSQGMTIHSIISQIDKKYRIYGQSYVLLSRLPNLNGLYLKKCDFEAIVANPKVVEYYNRLAMAQI